MQHLHFSFAALAAERPFVAKAMNARMSCSFRGYDIELSPLKNPGMYNPVWPFLDRVHTISNDLVKSARKLGMPENLPVVKIVPAIDAQLFAPNGKQAGTHAPLQLISIGRLTWQKGFVYSIEAVRMLKEEGLQVQYTIVGSGPQLDELRYQVYKCGLSSEVELCGKLTHELASKRLKQADIYLQPSVQEGFCNAALEAQATGLLTVVSNAGGLPENVVDGITGWVVPARDAYAIASKVKEICTMPATQQMAIAAAARLRIEQEFLLERQSAAFARFFADE